MSVPADSTPQIAIVLCPPTPSLKDLRWSHLGMKDQKAERTSTPRLLSAEMLRCLMTAQHTKTRRYVCDLPFRTVRLQGVLTDNDMKDSLHVQDEQGVHHATYNNSSDDFTFPAAGSQLPQSPQHLPGINSSIIEVETCCDKEALPHASDKQNQKNLIQFNHHGQEDIPSLQVVRLQLDPPVLEVVEAHTVVVVDSKRSLELYQIHPNRLLKLATGIRTDNMGYSDSPETPNFDDSGIGIIYKLDLASTEIVAEKVADNDIDVDSINHLLVPDHCMLLNDSFSSGSSTSLLSPPPPLRDIEEEDISPLQSPYDRCRTPSLLNLYFNDDVYPVIEPPTISTTILANGKHHPHPLRSNPVTAADCTSSPYQPRALFPVREDSLASSESSLKDSTFDTERKRKGSRPFFPPRKESLLSSNGFLSATKITRPSTSHADSYSSRSDIRTSVLEVPLFSPTAPTTPKTPDTPTQRAVKALHRRSASFANLLTSLTTPTTTRSQPNTTQISPPILIQAPAKSQSTVSIPNNVQVPAHAQTPYSMQRPSRSQTWNPAQHAEHLNKISPSLKVNLDRTRTASQTSLHSNYQNRKAFVMQGPNTSVFSLHSQNSTQDLKGMLSGYDTHPVGNVNALNKLSPAPSPAPSSFDTPESEGESLGTPITLKERRFRRILNLRRANAAFAAGTNYNARSGSFLAPVNESIDSKRTSIYSSLAPSQMQIDVAAATYTAKRQASVQVGTAGTRRR